MDKESPGQLIVRIRNYFNKSVELSEVGKTFEGVIEFMVREQFTNSCPKDVTIFLKERKPRNWEELTKMAEEYLDAHNKKLSTKTTVARHDVKDAGYGSHVCHEVFCVRWQRPHNCSLS